MSQHLATVIDTAWEDRANLGFDTGGEVRDAVEAALASLDAGEARVAEPDGEGGWRVNQWLKKAVLSASASTTMPSCRPGISTRCR